MDFLQDMPGYMWALMAVFMGLGIFLTILWIVMPFSIFGVKPLIKDMLHNLELMEGHLKELSAEAVRRQAEVPSASPEPAPAQAVEEEEEPPPMPM